MSLFIKKIIYACFIWLIIAMAIDYIISRALLKSSYFAHGETHIWNEIRKGHINDDLLIYGSSRAMTNFNTQIIEDSLNITAYNLGVDGHNFWLQYLRHKKLLKKNNPPKCIILSVGIYSLSKREDLYNHYQFLPFLYDKDFYDYTSSYKGFTILDYTLPLHRYLGKQDSIKKVFNEQQKEIKKPPYRIKGFRGMHRVWNQDLANAKLKMKSYKSIKDVPTLVLFQQFLEACKKLDITVVIVYSPEYIDGQLFISNREEIMSTYRDYAKINELVFMDYSNDPMCMNKDFFYNSMHLNAEGANFFTTKLVSDLERKNILNFNLTNKD